MLLYISSFLVFLVLTWSSEVQADSLPNVQKVLDDFFLPNVYNRDIRGRFDQTQAVEVNVSFSLKYIKSIDEIEGTIDMFGVLFLTWEDERLIWDTNAYNGTDRVYITADKIWRPEVTLENPSTSQNFFGDVSRIKSLHNSNGKAALTIGDMFHCSCHFDLTSFPWDQQKCSINFVVWGYTAKEVRLVGGHETIDLQNYLSNGIWTLLSTKVYSKPHPQKSFLVFEMLLQRRPAFFVLNILLPIVTLSVLELFAFIVPVESGERISFSLTVLLAIAVYMTLISDNLPPGAETMASMCYLLLFILVKSAFICLLNIFSVALYLRYLENPDVNTAWRKFVDIFSTAKRCKRPQMHTKRQETSETNRGDGNADSVRNSQTPGIDSQKTLTWKEVSKTFDRVVAICLTFLMFVGFSTYTYHVVAGRIVD